MGGGGFLAGKSSRVQQRARKRVCGYSYQVPPPQSSGKQGIRRMGLCSHWPHLPGLWSGPAAPGRSQVLSAMSEWDRPHGSSKVATSNPSFLSTNGSMGLGRRHSVHMSSTPRTHTKERKIQNMAAHLVSQCWERRWDRDRQIPGEHNQPA